MPSIANPDTAAPATPEPRPPGLSWLFMRPRDIGLFLRSARTDAAIADLRERLGQRAAFEAVYAKGDPWASGDSRYLYQRRKYEVLSSLLPPRRFARALDLGSGLGGLARKIAAQSDEVLGLDISHAAVERATALHGDLPNLGFAQGDVLNLPATLDRSFDLVTVADTLYYLPPPLADATLKALATRIARLLRPGGVLLLANHFFFTADPDSRLSLRIHRAFSWSPDLEVVSQHRRPFYLATLLQPAIPLQLTDNT